VAPLTDPLAPIMELPGVAAAVGRARDALVGLHNHPVNRALHMIAIPVGFSSLVVVWFHWIIALLLIPTAFALAWLGHLIEGNKPAFMTNPVHVFVAPIWLVKKIFGRGEQKSAAAAPRA